MQSKIFGLLATAGLAAAEASTVYTATSTADVAAAAATANTRSPTSNVKGKAFRRLAIIWLENTDYDMAAGDVTLSNHFAVTHPSEPNYVAAIGGD